jgi:hypothetical protein
LAEPSAIQPLRGAAYRAGVGRAAALFCPCHPETRSTLPDDPLTALDDRIATLRAARAAAPRFSEAFWEADDALIWLRAARDDLLRTGRIRDAVAAYLEAAPSSPSSEAADSSLPASERDAPIVAA